MVTENKELDDMVRKLLEENPGYVDYDDPTPIACDKDFRWYSAKQLRDKENESK